MTREQKLAKGGWTRQNTIDEPRLSELVELYKLLGFEVKIEPVTKKEMECMKCIETNLDRYKTIYTRQKRD